MVRVRCTDKLIIRSIHQIPDSLNFSGYIVHKFFGGNSCFLCLQLNFLSMFIGSCLEKYIVSLAPFVSCDRICQYDLISVADMRFA